MTALTRTDSDNTEAMEAVFDPQGTDAVFTIDPTPLDILGLAYLRSVDRDAADRLASAAGRQFDQSRRSPAISIMEPK